jgi:O-succinylhomoserine sulfhydrylase
MRSRDHTDPKRLPRVDLPLDARLDTLAVREGLPTTPWGENSEALFLTSSFVHPDAATAAARFAQEEERSSTAASPTRRR